MARAKDAPRGFGTGGHTTVARVEIVWVERLGGQEAYIRASGRTVLVLLPGWLRGTAHGQRLCAEAVSQLSRLATAV